MEAFTGLVISLIIYVNIIWVLQFLLNMSHSIPGFVLDSFLTQDFIYMQFVL